jgi:hypothetical protein
LVHLSVDPTHARLETLGLGVNPTRVTLPGEVPMVVAHDPNREAVEPIDRGETVDVRAQTSSVSPNPIVWPRHVRHAVRGSCERRSRSTGVR